MFIEIKSSLHSVVIPPRLDLVLLSHSPECDCVREAITSPHGAWCRVNCYVCTTEPCPCYTQRSHVHTFYLIRYCAKQKALLFYLGKFIFMFTYFLFWYNICQIWVRKK